MSLPQILSDAEIDAAGATLTVSVPDTWMQGRTVYGGLTAALALEAAIRSAPDLPPLRSAQIAFVGPLAGTVTVSTELLRRGRTAAFIEASVHADGKLGMKALFVFMVGLESSIDYSVTARPDVPGPGDAAPARANPDPKFFTSNLEYRHGLPIEARHDPDFMRWVRLKDRTGLHPMVELMAIGDALPPAAMALFSRPGPISSMTWQVNLLMAEPATSDGWWLSRSTADLARHGSSSQAMQVWNAAREPVVTGMQSVAIFV
ncbi:thioesterase family protein [Maricaulis sp.]|uniref:thioesterase family protein n=1 Tax=Maricaulis sp. TaxID=1486257 RepID=UPI002B26ECEE|nr:thioesterase family protein [Maricaulis sp.]